MVIWSCNPCNNCSMASSVKSRGLSTAVLGLALKTKTYKFITINQPIHIFQSVCNMRFQSLTQTSNQ